MIRKDIILIVILLFLTTSGFIAITNPQSKSINIKNENAIYSHNILGEFGTYTENIFNKYAHEALMYLYNKGDYPFYYVTCVTDKNIHANQRIKYELGGSVFPIVFWDGGFRKDIGASSNHSAVTKYKKSLNICENRTVADIKIFIDAKWLGAVNNNPNNGAIKVPINLPLTWTNSKMIVNVTVDNNDISQYNGHLHVYVCDVYSSMGWYDTADRLYTMAFLDYAFNHNITLEANSSCKNSTSWDGTKHTNGTHFFENVTEDNTMIIASVFDRDNYRYSDETTGIQVGVGTDPKTFDVYFGNKTPPPLVAMNITSTSLYPYYNISFTFNTTYYWRVDVCNRKGERIIGDIWNFTTRDNNPPNIPSNPIPNSDNVSICPVNFSWDGGDPDGDDVLYDVYCGRFGENLTLIASNIVTTWYQDSRLLDFSTSYYWKVIAYDEFGYNTSGSIWIFQTEDNLPPYTPSNPHPGDGDPNVPINVTLCWLGGDPNPCDNVTYDVFFDQNYPPLKVASNQTDNCYNPPFSLELFITYYWRVVAYDSEGLKIEGPFWMFTTGENQPPGPPKIEGPSPKVKIIHNPKPKPGTYNFTFYAIDPDRDNVFYLIDWDDGTYEDWFGPFLSGEKITQSHTYEYKGTFTIRAKAKDIWNQEGPWGKLNIPIQFRKQISFIFYLEILEQFPIIQRLFDILGWLPK